MADPKTLAAYAARTADYARMTEEARPGRWLAAFIAALPPGSRVLDLGCGPARASAFMRDTGLIPDPVDASPEMVALANETHDIGARLARFDEIDAIGTYDGVWANFSLLHAPKSELPGHLARLARALRPAGLLHLGMKLGTGEARDAIGRFYSYYSEEELTRLLSRAGFTVTATGHGQEKGLAGTLDDWIILHAHA